MSIDSLVAAAYKVATILTLAKEALTATQAAQKAQQTLVYTMEQEVINKEAVYLALQLESGNFLVKDYLQNTDDKLESTHIINNPTTQFYKRNKIHNTFMPNLKYEENSFIVLKKLPNELKEGIFLLLGLLINYSERKIYVIEIILDDVDVYFFTSIDKFLDNAFLTIEIKDNNKFNYLLDCFDKSIKFIKDKDVLKRLIEQIYTRITSYRNIERTIPK